MIRAAIFDMDGLLVDSEPLWTQAEIEVFGAVGLALDPEQCRQTVGLGLEKVGLATTSDRELVECVALEDSVTGLIAAKAARMKAIAVPERNRASDPRYTIADITLGSLLEFDDRIWTRLQQESA